MTLVPLFDLTQQFNNKSGAILVGGRLYVYYVGRTDLAKTWADEDAHAQNTNPILLDSNGRAKVFVDDSYSYTLVVCDRNGAELFSQDITPGSTGGAGGGRIVYHDETLTGDGTQTSLLGANTFPLGVDSTMTAYTGVAENKDALILGVNGDWFSANYLDKFNDKVDWSAFNSACSGIQKDLNFKVNLSSMSSYYTKPETNNLLTNYVKTSSLNNTLQNYYNKSQTNELLSGYVKTSSMQNYYTKTETDSLLGEKQDSLTFGYDSDSAISSINGSALKVGSEGVKTFPILGDDGVNTYLADMNCSSFLLTAGRYPQGASLKQTARTIQYQSYPNVNESASWYKILTAVNNKSNTYCVNFTDAKTAIDLEDYSAFDKLTIVHGVRPSATCHLYWKNRTKLYNVLSGFYLEMVKSTDFSGNLDWFFESSGFINNHSWDVDN